MMHYIHKYQKQHGHRRLDISNIASKMRGWLGFVSACFALSVFYIGIVRSADSTENADPCSQPPETGNCKAAIPMWFYDKNKDECKEFIYGGCGGSENKFSSRSACIKKCASHICLLPADTGDCRANIRQWFYESRHRTCKEFSYGGCKGNLNRFPDKQSCEVACAGSNLLCEMGRKFQAVGQHGVVTGSRESDWFLGGCERKCRKFCLKSHSWGVCMGFSTDKKWYGKCRCYLFDRFLSAEEFDTDVTGITKNRMCKEDKKSGEGERELR